MSKIIEAVEEKGKYIKTVKKMDIYQGSNGTYRVYDGETRIAICDNLKECEKDIKDYIKGFDGEL